MSETEVVCDAGPVIHLDEISSLDLLADFAVWIPRTVAVEVARHRPRALDEPPFAAMGPRSEAEPEDPRLAAVIRAFSLDAGEVSALGVALGRPGAILLTDDAAARLAAKSLGVPSYGTLGIVLRALRRGLRSRAQVLDLLGSIPNRSSLHLSRSILDEAIRQIPG